jgi:integrase
MSIREALRQYLALRRSLGWKYYDYGLSLAQFVERMERERADFITVELAIRWATEPQLVQKATWARRLGMVRGFARWLASIDQRTQVPPTRILDARRRRRQPHIYTLSEVQRLMAATEFLRAPAGLRATTYATLLGLLWATGIRPGEALGLDVNDVDLRQGVLAIRDSKFGKSRFVPIDETTRIALTAYATRSEGVRRCSAFLISNKGLRLNGGNARRTFVGLSRTAGLRPPSSVKQRHGWGPRLQDFRHTFTTLKLVEWYRSGIDVHRELPKLVTYLGHVDVAFTYWYIEGIPELLQLARQASEKGRQP